MVWHALRKEEQRCLFLGSIASSGYLAVVSQKECSAAVAKRSGKDMLGERRQFAVVHQDSHATLTSAPRRFLLSEEARTKKSRCRLSSTSSVDLKTRRGQRGQINQCHRSRRYGRLLFTGRKPGASRSPHIQSFAFSKGEMHVSCFDCEVYHYLAMSTRRHWPKSKRIVDLLSNEVHNSSCMAITWSRGASQLCPTIIFHI